MRFKLLAACSILIVIGVAAYYWNLDHPEESHLSDGRVVFYEKMMKGTKISESEFEPDVYAYSLDYFQPKRRLIDQWFDRLKNYGASGRKQWFHFSPAPERMIGGVRDPVSTAYQPSELDDGHGQKSLVFWKSCPPGQAGWVNHAPLPKGAAQWVFDFKTAYQPSVGRITIPNRSFDPIPGFKGKHPPLESRSGRNVLKLVSARSLRGMTFDVSGCPDLLPCQVLGVRVTDAWGNTALAYGSLDRDGKTIGIGSIDDCSGKMQSPNFHVRIAVCRGLGAKVAPGETVCFDRLPAKVSITPGVKRTLHGRDLTLMDAGFPVHTSQGIVRFSACWQLDHHGPVLWPVITRIVGRTEDGGTMEMDPIHQGLEHSVRLVRFNSNQDYDPMHLVKNRFFKANYTMPLNLVDYDLYVMLEEPTVFEFYVNVDY